MPARILWRDAQGREGQVDVQGDVLVGRAGDCAIRTDDPMVSRNHARIGFREGRYMIEDLNSSNGVYVDEQRVRLHPLAHGAVVRCGSLWLRFLDETPAQQWPTPAAAPAPAPVPAPYPAPGGFAPQPAAPPPGYPAAATPYPVAPQPAAPPPVAPMPQPTSAPAAIPVAAGGAPAPTGPSAAEVARMQRRIEQMQTEIRMLRGGGDRATRFEEVEEKASKLEREKSDLEAKIKELENQLVASATDKKAIKATAMSKQINDSVAGLNDVLSEMRINIIAAQGEVEQWSSNLPKAQFELVREALRSCVTQMEQAKGLIRQLQQAS